MPLDGLRAWIGEVERKLGMRTRVFLVLAVIAIGGAGAAIYLAVDARNGSVSEGDVQVLQEKLEAKIGEGNGSVAGSDTGQLETELKALQAQVEQLSGEGGTSGQEKGSAGGGTGNNDSSSTGVDRGSTGSAGGSSSSEGSSTGTAHSDTRSARLQELLEETQKQNAQAESEQGER